MAGLRRVSGCQTIKKRRYYHQFEKPQCVVSFTLRFHRSLKFSPGAGNQGLWPARPGSFRFVSVPVGSFVIPLLPELWAGAIPAQLFRRRDSRGRPGWELGFFVVCSRGCGRYTQGMDALAIRRLAERWTAKPDLLRRVTRSKSRSHSDTPGRLLSFRDVTGPCAGVAHDWRRNSVGTGYPFRQGGALGWCSMRAKQVRFLHAAVICLKTCRACGRCQRCECSTAYG